jgi:hypothetical protein
LANFLNESLEKKHLSSPFIASTQGTDMKGSMILRALKNLSLVERDFHVTFDNAYWAQRRDFSRCHLTNPSKVPSVCKEPHSYFICLADGR